MPYVNGIMGNLVNNPELKATQSGKYVCNFTLANNYGYGENQRTDFVYCNAFGKTAEMITSHFKKGDAIIVQGEFHNRPYKKNDAGYDIPNWVYSVSSVVFVPKSKSNGEKKTAEKQDATDSLMDTQGFEEIEGTEDLPF